mmetsp:Transcript_23728/g.67021  ORF Transcript_23728/g.67021 Transcript_23728/m.67021 type:complete len:328 (+) Transcript_23728:264-1247(+)
MFASSGDLVHETIGSGGLLVSPPHDVSGNADDDEDEKDPSEDGASLLAGAGLWHEFLDVLASGDVLTVVGEVLHLLLALGSGVRVGALAQLTELLLVVVVVDQAGVALGGDHAAIGEREGPSVGDLLERGLGHDRAHLVGEESDLDVDTVISAGWSDEVLDTVVVVAVVGIIAFVLHFVLAALGVLVGVEVVAPVHVVALVLEVGLDEGVESDDHVSVAAAAARIVIAGVGWAQTDDDGVVLVLSVLLVDNDLSGLAADELEGVLGEESVLAVVLLLLLAVLLVEETGLADDLVGGVLALDGHGRSDGEEGGGDESKLHGGKTWVSC